LRGGVGRERLGHGGVGEQVVVVVQRERAAVGRREGARAAQLLRRQRREEHRVLQRRRLMIVDDADHVAARAEPPGERRAGLLIDHAHAGDQIRRGPLRAGGAGRVRVRQRAVERVGAEAHRHRAELIVRLSGRGGERERIGELHRARARVERLQRDRVGRGRQLHVQEVDAMRAKGDGASRRGGIELFQLRRRNLREIEEQDARRRAADRVLRHHQAIVVGAEAPVGRFLAVEHHRVVGCTLHRDGGGLHQAGLRDDEVLSQRRAAGRAVRRQRCDGRRRGDVVSDDEAIAVEETRGCRSRCRSCDRERRESCFDSMIAHIGFPPISIREKRTRLVSTISRVAADEEFARDSHAAELHRERTSSVKLAPTRQRPGTDSAVLERFIWTTPDASKREPRDRARARPAHRAGDRPPRSGARGTARYRRASSRAPTQRKESPPTTPAAPRSSPESDPRSGDAVGSRVWTWARSSPS
jgi:hypothetical protein